MGCKDWKERNCFAGIESRALIGFSRPRKEKNGNSFNEFWNNMYVRKLLTIWVTISWSSLSYIRKITVSRRINIQPFAYLITASYVSIAQKSKWRPIWCCNSPLAISGDYCAERGFFVVSLRSSKQMTWLCFKLNHDRFLNIPSSPLLKIIIYFG
jgi:hypothetical protein